MSGGPGENVGRTQPALVRPWGQGTLTGIRGTHEDAVGVEDHPLSARSCVTHTRWARCTYPGQAGRDGTGVDGAALRRPSVPTRPRCAGRHTGSARRGVHDHGRARAAALSTRPATSSAENRTEMENHA